MEVTTVTSQVIPGRRRSCTIGGGGVETKCVKRRRRDSSAAAASSCSEGGQKQQLQSQGDQNTTAAATTVKRSSRFRGVSRHRWTGRYEAHLWDKGSWNPTQRKKGKQVYLGAYDEEESAARAYDLAALKYWGASTFTNFPVSDYEKEVEIMKNVTREEYLATLRRRSSGFSRGVSKYRGVARHHHNGRWEARIGRVFGNKYLYLGTYSSQEEAAHAYDIAAIEYRGINAVTNFDLSTYIRWLKPGANTTPALLEPKPTYDPLLIPTFSTQNLIEKTTQMPNFQYSDLNSPGKQEILQKNPATISPCTKSSSSPTALSLLLKSSVFKDLVEKNLQEESEAKNFAEMCGNNSTEAGGIFCNGISPVQYMCPSNGDMMPGFEFKEENFFPFYNK